MQITDEMVAAASLVICRSGKFETGQGTCALLCMGQLGDPRKRGCSNATVIHGKLMRAALEAALGARSKLYADILLALRGVTPDNKLAHDAASCIEELARELDKIAPPKREGWVDHPARATLERWGLK